MARTMDVAVKVADCPYLLQAAIGSAESCAAQRCEKRGLRHAVMMMMAIQYKNAWWYEIQIARYIA